MKALLKKWLNAIANRPFMQCVQCVGLLLFCPDLALASDGLRIGQWHADLSYEGPGLLIAELLKQEEEFAQLAHQMKALELDILVMTDVDQDDEAWAADLLRALFGFRYAHLAPNNAGLWLQGDLNQDGRREQNDKQSYADFRGQGAMLVLSQSAAINAQSFNKLLLKDHSDAPMKNGKPYYSEAVWNELRLASSAFLDIEFEGFHVLSAHATAPSFEGEDRRNTLRNASEIDWWSRYISGDAFLNDNHVVSTLDAPFILVGTLNVDPLQGAGDQLTLQKLLQNPRLRPVEFAQRETVDWREIGLGEMQVDYILPSCEWQAVQTGQLEMGTPHRVLWAELKPIENAGKNCNF